MTKRLLDFKENPVQSLSLTELSLWNHSIIKNNIPLTVRTVKIYFSFYHKDTITDNLPVTIEKIKIEFPQLKHLIKVPFGCLITDFYDNPL